MWFIITLLGVFSSVSSSPHFYKTPANSRLILNPFSAFGNPACVYDGKEGRCFGEVECLTLAGTFGEFCPGYVTGLCCLFYRNCGHRTSQEVAYFRNAHWPVVSAYEDNCDFRVIKHDDSFCGLRIEPEQSGSKSGDCGSLSLKVTGVPFDGEIPLCGTRSLGSYQLDMKHVNELTLKMNFKKRTNNAWNVKVTQVPCDEFDGEILPGSEPEITTTTRRPRPSKRPKPPKKTTTMNPFLTGRPSTSTTPFPPTIFTTSTTSASPPAPPPPTTSPVSQIDNYALCGIEGPATKSVKRKPTRRGPTGPVFSTRDETAVIDDVWAAPTINDSTFAQLVRDEPNYSDFNRITYGLETGKHQFPWQVAMTVNGRFHCGGSVVGDYFILTAAHCVISYKNRPSAITLALGEHDLKSTTDGPTLRATPVSIRVHSGYSRTTLQNDIAIIKVQDRIDYSYRIRPICLPPKGIFLDNKRSTITGWGRNEYGRLETKLHFLTSRFVTNDLCSERWGNKGSPKNFIRPTMACMTAIEGDSCNGDSGGPAVMYHGSSLVQVGVVSFGSASCTDENLPGVYTRVSEYVDWIRQQMY